jgi:hypothetical protein
MSNLRKRKFRGGAPFQRCDRAEVIFLHRLLLWQTPLGSCWVNNDDWSMWRAGRTEIGGRGRGHVEVNGREQLCDVVGDDLV